MEYEYSFKVSSLKEYIKFFQTNNFKLLSTSKQTRTIYRNSNQTIARITIDRGEKIVKKLDFKEDKSANHELFIRKESASLSFEDETAVNSILDFLGYIKDKTLVRTRTIYTKEKVKVELDEYELPEAYYVVGIEGTKQETDLVYQLLKDINKKYKVQ